MISVNSSADKTLEGMPKKSGKAKKTAPKQIKPSDQKKLAAKIRIIAI